MGFLDSLFGSKEDGPEKIRLSELGQWIDAQTVERDKKAEKAAVPLIRKARSIACSIVEDIDDLEKAKLPKDVHKRAAKAVKSGKPSFIRSMRSALDSVDRSPDDSSEFGKVLSDSLQAIGKASVGPGRYLSLGYPEIIKSIQSSSKELLAVSDGIKEAHKPTKEHERIIGLKTAFDGYQESLAKSLNLMEILGKTRSKRSSDLERLSLIRSETEKVKKSMEGPPISDVRDSIKKYGREISSYQARIRSLISPLTRGLRKYSKVSIDQTHMISKILEDPVSGCVESGDEKLKKLLAGFLSSLEKGSIKLKDREKTLKKTSQAFDGLTDDLFESYRRSCKMLCESKRKLEKFTEFERAKSLGEKEAAIRIELDADDAEAKRMDESLKNQRRIQKELLEKIRALLQDMGYLLIE